MDKIARNELVEISIQNSHVPAHCPWKNELKNTPPSDTAWLNGSNTKWQLIDRLAIRDPTYDILTP